MADITEELARLEWLETATVRAYESVEQRIVDEDLRQRLGGCRADHSRHRGQVTRLLGAGGEARPSPEFAAFVREELLAVQQADDVEQALEQLLVLERANASFFADTLAAGGLPPDALRVVSEEREDEEQHVPVIATQAAHVPPMPPESYLPKGAPPE